MADAVPAPAGAAKSGSPDAAPEVLDAALAVHASNIPGAGMGLFSTVDIPQGACVTLYTGTVLRTAAAAKVKQRAYMMRLGPQVYIDGREHPEMLGRYINDACSAGLTNAYFDKRPEERCAAVIALRDIQAGEEIFVRYGAMYWIKGGGVKLQRPEGTTGCWPRPKAVAELRAGHDAAIAAAAAALTPEDAVEEVTASGEHV